MAITLTRYSIDVTDSSKTSLFSYGWFIKSFKVTESLNEFPTAELILIISTNISNLLQDYTNLFISINTYDGTSLKYVLGVKQLVMKGSQLTISGYLTPYENFMVTGSAYLGNSLDSAISFLGIRDYIGNIDKVPGRYYQISESKLAALMRLTRGIGERRAVAITNSSINSIDISSTSNSQDFLPPNDVKIGAINTAALDTNLITESVYDDGTYTYGYNGDFYIGYNNQIFTKNLVSNIKYRYPIDRWAQFIYLSELFPYELGSCMKLNLAQFPYSTCIITDKVTEFTDEGNINTEVLIGGSF